MSQCVQELIALSYVPQQHNITFRALCKFCQTYIYTCVIYSYLKIVDNLDLDVDLMGYFSF